jgi:hypothetical protein
MVSLVPSFSTVAETLESSETLVKEKTGGFCDGG